MSEKMLATRSFTLCLSLIFPAISLAGQISVINPSASSTEATGVVTLIPPSAPTPTSVNASGSYSETSGIVSALGPKLTIVVEALNAIDVTIFTAEQRQSLLEQIKLQLSDPIIHNDAKLILREQLLRLKQHN